ncbi:MAG: carboxypeptidase regulatory-like domain-containing protein, partial [Armatimonadetes bacterium]|nr:carboxypeptidase regulatory-like domain-containing protein [Armatimonadota bacterium]
MTTRRASTVAALLLLQILGLSHRARAEHNVQAVALASVAYQDGPLTRADLVPLTPVASRFGVIVTITGSHVNVVRQDGTEVRLKGAAPGEAWEDEGTVLLLQRGDAWVQRSQLPQLLGISQKTRARTGIEATSLGVSAGHTFESFEVRKPVIARQPVQKRPGETSRGRRFVPTEAQDGREYVQTEVGAVEVGLGVSRVSTFGTPSMSGIYQEVIGPGSPVVVDESRQIGEPGPVDHTVPYVSMNAVEGDREICFGDMSDPLFGPGTGFELRTLTRKGAWFGASLLAPTGAGTEPEDARVALRAGAVTPTGFDGEVALSPDGSHLLIGQWLQPTGSLRVSLVDRLDLRHHDLFWNHQVLPTMKLFGRQAKTAGRYDAETQLLGLDWRVGRTHFGWEQQRGVSAGDEWARDALSLSLLERRTSLSLRYILPHQQADCEGLEWFVSRFDSSGRQLYFSSSAPGIGSMGADRAYRFGASLPVKQHLRWRIGMEANAEGLQPEGKLEWRPSSDAMVSLRYGLLDSDFSGDTVDRGVVVQASFAFGGGGPPPQGTGRIVGSVKDDAGSGVADVAVVLEEMTVTFTRTDGSFEFSGVAPGRQRVKL